MGIPATFALTIRPPVRPTAARTSRNLASANTVAGNSIAIKSTLGSPAGAPGVSSHLHALAKSPEPPTRSELNPPAWASSPVPTFSYFRRICHDDLEALSVIDEAMTGKPGDNQYTQVVDNVNDQQRTTGNSSTYALRRLKRQAPAILENSPVERLRAAALLVLG